MIDSCPRIVKLISVGVLRMMNVMIGDEALSADDVGFWTEVGLSNLDLKIL